MLPLRPPRLRLLPPLLRLPVLLLVQCLLPPLQQTASPRPSPPRSLPPTTRAHSRRRDFSAAAPVPSCRCLNELSPPLQALDATDAGLVHRLCVLCSSAGSAPGAKPAFKAAAVAAARIVPLLAPMLQLCLLQQLGTALLPDQAGALALAPLTFAWLLTVAKELLRLAQRVQQEPPAASPEEREAWLAIATHLPGVSEGVGESLREAELPEKLWGARTSLDDVLTQLANAARSSALGL